MTIEERAACIADVSLAAGARGMERRRRIYKKALQMLQELAEEAGKGDQRYADRKR